MAHRKLLRFALTLALFLVCAGSRQAAAQLGTGGSTGLTGTGGTTGTSAFASTDFFVGVQAIKGVNLSTFDVARFFNVARCQCATPVYLFISLQQSGFAKRAQVIASTGNTGRISVWLGPSCANTLYQGDTSLCRQLANESLLTFLNQGSLTIATDAQTLSTPLAGVPTFVDGGITTSTPGSCSAGAQFAQTVLVLLDTNGDNVPDDPQISNQLTIDLAPPPAPTNPTVQGGNEALIMKWDQVDQSVNPDLLGYQILCSRADAYQVFNEHSTADGGSANGPFGASFVSCPKGRAAAGIDGGVEGLDPTYVCSPLLSAFSTSYRVQILQNDITYAAAVVAIDNSGNASQPAVIYGTPIKTLSFYDVYRDGFAASNNTSTPDPGAASGGFCAVAVRRPRAGSFFGALAAFGLVATGIAFARRRRRGGR